MWPGSRGLKELASAHDSSSNGGVRLVISQLSLWRASANDWISKHQTLNEPVLLSVASAGLGIVLYVVWKQYLEFRRQVRAHGSLQKAIVAKVFECLDTLPAVRKLKKEKIEEVRKMGEQVETGGVWFFVLFCFGLVWWRQGW